MVEEYRKDTSKIFLETLRTEVSQGDIFADAPVAAPLEYPLTILRGNPPSLTQFEELGKLPGGFKKEGETCRMRITRSFGMLMTHDCQYDNHKSDPCLLVQVRLMTVLSPKEVDEMWRAKSKFRHLPLPHHPTIGCETYVDFRRVTSVKREQLDRLPRVASLTDDGRGLFVAAVIAFFTRKDLRGHTSADE